MNKKIIIVMIVFAVLILIAFLILWLLGFWQKPTNTNLNTNKAANANLVVNTQVNMNANVEPVKSEDKVKAELSRIANSFVERFGSYSNQSNFENVSSIRVYMTENMKKWSDDFVKAYRQNNPDTSIYFGITTKAISTKLTGFSDKEAAFTITTQRKESTGTTDNARVYYQDISVKFAKEQGVWKVNEAKWQEAKT